MQTRMVLRALSESAPGWRYGYDLSRQLMLSSGTLYPLLARLKDQGLVEAEWQPSPLPGRPPRHAYRLTQAGRHLAAAVAEVAAGAASGALASAAA